MFLPFKKNNLQTWFLYTLCGVYISIGPLIGWYLTKPNSIVHVHCGCTKTNHEEPIIQSTNTKSTQTEPSTSKNMATQTTELDVGETVVQDVIELIVPECPTTPNSKSFHSESLHSEFIKLYAPGPTKISSKQTSIGFDDDNVYEHLYVDTDMTDATKDMFTCTPSPSCNGTGL